MKRTVRSEFGELFVRDTGIIHARIFPSQVIDVARANEYHELVVYLSSNQPHVSVIDITGINSITSDARAQLQKNSSEWGNTLAVALITNSFTARVVGNFFLTLNKPSYPIKIFSDSSVANQWAKNEYVKRTPRLASAEGANVKTDSPFRSIASIASDIIVVLPVPAPPRITET
mgnify:CR=1 FL=1